jgi:hypothetical protein
VPPNSAGGPGIDLNALQEMLSKSKIELDRNNNVSEMDFEYGGIKIRGTPEGEGIRVQLDVPNPVQAQKPDQPPHSEPAFKHPNSKRRKRLDKITHFVQDNVYLKAAIKIAFLYFYMNCFLVQPWVNSWSPRIHTWKIGDNRYLNSYPTDKKNFKPPQDLPQMEKFDPTLKSQPSNVPFDPTRVIPPALLEVLKAQGMTIATDKDGN